MILTAEDVDFYHAAASASHHQGAYPEIQNSQGREDDSDFREDSDVEGIPRQPPIIAVGRLRNGKRVQFRDTPSGESDDSDSSSSGDSGRSPSSWPRPSRDLSWPPRPNAPTSLDWDRHQWTPKYRQHCNGVEDHITWRIGFDLPLRSTGFTTKDPLT